MEDYNHLWKLLETDIPVDFLPFFEKQLKNIPDGYTGLINYMNGILSLKQNDHQRALNYFFEATNINPEKVGPKLHYIYTTMEMNIADESKEGYYRDYFLYQLSYLNSVQIESFVLAINGLKKIWDKQKLSGIEDCKKAEVKGNNFYPTLYIVTRAYGEVGDLNSFTSRWNQLQLINPRVTEVERLIFRAKSNRF